MKKDIEGQSLTSGSGDKAITLRDTAIGAKLRTLAGHDDFFGHKNTSHQICWQEVSKTLAVFTFLASLTGLGLKA